MDNKILSSRYKIIRALSKGGFGSTYLAEDTQYPDNQQCVVKKLHSNVADREFLKIARRLFKKEANALAELGEHPQIPRLLAFFEEQEEFYLVQAYVRGKILTQELNTSTPWSEDRVIDFLQDILQIVDFIHSKGIIHRDIKPDNLICRDSDRKLVLVDFGTVKEVVMARTEAIALTVSVGTRGYMPTEQARGKPRFASDIYAVGMIAIQALTGMHPLQLSEDENGEVQWQDRANCKPQLAEIISKMVRYHFKERYQSAQEILTNLSILENNNSHRIDSDLTGIVAPQTDPIGHSQVNSTFKPSASTFNSKLNITKPILLVLGGLLLIGSGIFGGRYLIGNSADRSQARELELAEQKAQLGDYEEAIAIAGELPTTTEIQQQIDDWSEKLLDRANSIYTQQGNLEAASQIINDIIPDSSPAKKTGRELLSGWEKEYEFNQSILNIAKEELQRERWQNAKQEAARIIDTAPYWQQQTAKITRAADLGEKSPSGVVDLCSKAIDLCN